MNLSRMFHRREANRLRLLEPPTKRRAPRSAFRRITSATSPVPGTISYRHPTKGLRFRRATPQLFVALLPAFARKAA